jgi:hypothetical protein
MNLKTKHYEYLIMENIKYSIIEIKKNDEKSNLCEILKCVEEQEVEGEEIKNNNEGDNFSAIFFLMEGEYNVLTKKELERICDYYKISKRKKNKADLIQDIIIFEQDQTNNEIVERRTEMWYCIEQIKSDKYLKKFLILD